MRQVDALQWDAGRIEIGETLFSSLDQNRLALFVEVILGRMCFLGTVFPHAKRVSVG